MLLHHCTITGFFQASVYNAVESYNNQNSEHRLIRLLLVQDKPSGICGRGLHIILNLDAAHIFVE
jgi:hypothetical protein